MESYNRTNTGEVSFEIKEHIGIIDIKDNGWTREVNSVSWNGGVPKIDIREWAPGHERMSRGITLTEEQAEKLAKILSGRYRAREEPGKEAPARNDVER